MNFISHRGNLYGIDKASENSPTQIEYCINNFYDVEVDMRYIKGSWFLGHDEPQYKISLDWLITFTNKLWIHCKNIEALNQCSQHHLFHYFWHDKDKYTLTSKGIVWAYPGEKINNNTVCVLPEMNNSYTIQELSCSYGICSDNIFYYKNILGIN